MDHLSTSNCNGTISVPPLHKMKSIIVDDNGIWHRPEYPEYKQELSAAKPFLVPSFDEGVVEVLPSEKQNRKINFIEEVSVMEIENRFQLMDSDECSDEDSYEIEIVEGSGEQSSDDDADFYLEMIDGEIFYVFETEDDISVSDEEYESDESSESSLSDSEIQTPSGEPKAPLQLCIGDLMAPVLDDSIVDLNVVDVEELNDDEEENNMLQEVEEQLRENALLENLNAKTDAMVEDVPEVCGNTLSPRPVGKQSVIYNTPPGSPLRAAVAENPDSSNTPRSILKVGPPSPVFSVHSLGSRKKDKKNKRDKKDKKEKTFIKTFVRASDFDGEHRVYNWEKPTWTEKQLKSTGKGEDIRQGANLAGPVTNAKKLIESGKFKWEKPEWARGDESEHVDDLDAKQELIRKIQDGTMNLPGLLNNNKRRLKLSINGCILADGGDIVKPITKATVIRKPANINYIANPKILRATPGGQKLWKGENLAGPVTQATTVKKYEWEKPSWVKAKLNHTDMSSKGRSGQDPAATSGKLESISWEKPEWTNKREVRRADSESTTGLKKKEYTWEKPSWAKVRSQKQEEISEVNSEQQEQQEGSLKPTGKGRLLRQGEKLEKPITSLPQSANSEHPKDFEKTGARRLKSCDFLG